MNGAVGFEASAKVIHSCWSRIPPLHHVSASWLYGGGRFIVTGHLSTSLLYRDGRYIVTGRVPVVVAVSLVVCPGRY